jgi:hypothetical protein
MATVTSYAVFIFADIVAGAMLIVWDNEAEGKNEAYGCAYGRYGL